MPLLLESLLGATPLAAPSILTRSSSCWLLPVACTHSRNLAATDAVTALCAPSDGEGDWPPPPSSFWFWLAFGLFGLLGFPSSSIMASCICCCRPFNACTRALRAFWYCLGTPTGNHSGCTCDEKKIVFNRVWIMGAEGRGIRNEK